MLFWVQPAIDESAAYDLDRIKSLAQIVQDDAQSCNSELRVYREMRDVCTIWLDALQQMSDLWPGLAVAIEGYGISLDGSQNEVVAGLLAADARYEAETFNAFMEAIYASRPVLTRIELMHSQQ